MNCPIATPAHAAAVAITALALAACSSNDSGQDDAKPKASATEQEPSQQQKDDTAKAAGIPPEPTGAEREQLLRALAAANPDIRKSEDKAVDAARSQCSAINNGAAKLDWSASQRFAYEREPRDQQHGLPVGRAVGNRSLDASG
jgi:hypothetical protein